jgi:uncharacterized protein (DUF2141 family)
MRWIKGSAAALLLPGLSAGAPASHLAVPVEGLRSAKGVLQLCLTRDPVYFPDCGKDPERRHLTVEAAAGDILFSAVPAGRYALSIIHDENANARLDTFMGIPKEGVGFSRNPRLSFGPPSFRSVEFAVEEGTRMAAVRMRYFL